MPLVATGNVGPEGVPNASDHPGLARTARTFGLGYPDSSAAGVDFC